MLKLRHAKASSLAAALALCLACSRATSGTPAPEATREDTTLSTVVHDEVARVGPPTTVAVSWLADGHVTVHSNAGGAKDEGTPMNPGSTVKPLLAWVAAEQGELTADEVFDCSGHYDGFRCHGVHGSQPLERALATSCNIYFFRLADRVGIDAIARGFESFGLGVELPSSSEIPNPMHLARLVGTGHGPLLTTPAVLARAYAEFLRRLRSPNAPKLELVANGIERGLRGAVSASDGTARAAAVPGLDVMGKTGGAQSQDGREQSWFVGLVPFERPRLLVVVRAEANATTPRPAPAVAARILEGLRDRGVAGLR